MEQEAVAQSAKKDTIVKFIIRVAIVIVAWKTLYYFLKPVGIPDNFLTTVTTQLTTDVLQLLWDASIYWKWNGGNTAIYLGTEKILGIGDPCNGLEVLVLYVGFILCLPTNFKRMATFIPLGVAVIFVLNIIRTSAIAMICYRYHEWFDFLHLYLFKIIIYAVIFLMWVKYAKQYSIFKK